LFWNNKKILVTGGGGFLGSYLVSELKKKGIQNLVISSSKENDLRILENCKKIVKNVNYVFHLAGNVGGIGLNQEKPGELFYNNIMMGTQLLDESRKAGVEKFIALGTICSYPKFTPVPFTESSIWEGYPEETNAAYGLAKKMLLVQSQAYRKQYNFKSIVLIPTNLYGPKDNFNPRSSHVIPALILKIYNAKKFNKSSINVWGDGTPTRDFLYVEDAAKGIIQAAEKYDDDSPLNLGSAEEISIKNIVTLLCELMEFNGTVVWDNSKPNGQPRRCVSYSKAEEKIGFKPQIKLKDGLKKTVEYFYQSNIE